MSITVLYKAIPVERRLCHHCGKPVIRNIDLINGEIWHHGCLNHAGLQLTHRCVDCYNLLTPDRIILTDYDGVVMKTCGLCGSARLKSLRGPHAEENW